MFERWIHPDSILGGQDDDSTTVHKHCDGCLERAIAVLSPCILRYSMPSQVSQDMHCSCHGTLSETELFDKRTALLCQ